MLKQFTKLCSSSVFSLLVLGGCAAMPFGDNEPDPVEKTVETTAQADSGSVESASRISMFVTTPDVKSNNRTKFDRAVVLLQAEDYLVAESFLLEVTADQPELAGPWVNLAFAQLGQDKREQAQVSLARALTANPHNCDARNQLGILAREDGKFELAESHYRACIEANPSHLQAQLNLGILYELYMGRYSEALAMYQDYQLARQEPDQTVNGWLLDLERRVAALAQR